MSTKAKDSRRGLASAHQMHRLSQCPGSLTLINLLRAEGRLYQLPSPHAASGIRIHEWLAEKSNGLLPAEQRIANQAQQLRQALVGQWDSDTFAELEIIKEKRFWYRQGILPRF